MDNSGYLRPLSEQDVENPLQREFLNVLDLISEIYQEEEWGKLMQICLGQESGENSQCKPGYWSFVRDSSPLFARYFGMLRRDITFHRRIVQINILQMLVFLRYSNMHGCSTAASQCNSENNHTGHCHTNLDELNVWIEQITHTLDQARTTINSGISEDKIIDMPQAFRSKINSVFGK